MSSQSAYDLIKQQLEAVVGTSFQIIDWDNLDDTLEQSRVPFLSIADVPSVEEVVSVGSPQANWFREQGEVDVHIFVPAVGGFPPARTIAETIRSGLRMKTLSPEVSTLVVTPPEPGIIADGLWTSMLVGVNFRRHYLAATA
jgi:hypothetical protein